MKGDSLEVSNDTPLKNSFTTKTTIHTMFDHFRTLLFSVNYFRQITELQTYELLKNESNKGAKSDILRYEVYIK